jgi:uncharacterized membrane protein YwzB
MIDTIALPVWALQSQIHELERELRKSEADRDWWARQAVRLEGISKEQSAETQRLRARVAELEAAQMSKRAAG